MKRKVFDIIWGTVIAVIVVLAAIGMVMPIVTAKKAEAKLVQKYSSFADTTEYVPQGQAKLRYFEPMDSLSEK